MLMSTEFYVLNNLMHAKLRQEAAKHREQQQRRDLARNTLNEKEKKPTKNQKKGNLKQDNDKPTKNWEHVFE